MCLTTPPVWCVEISELPGLQHYQGTTFHDFDPRFLRLLRQCKILRARVHDNSARLCLNDLVDEWIRTRFAKVHRDGIDGLRCVGKFRVTLFVEDFVESRIDRDRLMTVIAQHSKGFVSVTIWLR